MKIDEAEKKLKRKYSGESGYQGYIDVYSKNHILLDGHWTLEALEDIVATLKDSEE